MGITVHQLIYGNPNCLNITMDVVTEAAIMLVSFLIKFLIRIFIIGLFCIDCFFLVFEMHFRYLVYASNNAFFVLVLQVFYFFGFSPCKFENCCF